jgi:hypothetical protein
MYKYMKSKEDLNVQNANELEIFQCEGRSEKKGGTHHYLGRKMGLKFLEEKNKEL